MIYKFLKQEWIELTFNEIDIKNILIKYFAGRIYISSIYDREEIIRKLIQNKTYSDVEKYLNTLDIDAYDYQNLLEIYNLISMFSKVNTKTRAHQ